MVPSVDLLLENTLRFRLKSCGNFQLRLVADDVLRQWNSSYYEFGISMEASGAGAIFSSLAKVLPGDNFHVAQTQHSQHILQCNSWVSFWLTWNEEGEISLGIAGNAVAFLHYKDQHPLVPRRVALQQCCESTAAQVQPLTGLHFYHHPRCCP